MTMEQNAKWYVANVQGGQEGSIKKAIEEKAEARGMSEYFEEILIPTHEVTEVKQGKRVQTEKKFFPGYMLIKMIMTDDSWHLVKDLPKVSGFLGAQNKPTPISPREAKKLMSALQEQQEHSVSMVSYEIGDTVKVIDGPFASFTGTVEQVEEDKQRMKVSVSIFGRPTQVDLEFVQVEKD